MLLHAGADPTALHYDAYENARYRFSLPIPSGLSANPPPVDGDGRSFVRSVGGARIVAYGSINFSNVPTMQRFSDAKADARARGVDLTYESVADDWFVLSGLNDDRVTYQWMQRARGGAWVTLDINYDADLKPLLDPVTRHVSTHITVDDATPETSVADAPSAQAEDNDRALFLTDPRLNGRDVRTVQQVLLDLGYLNGPGEVDGWYGPITEGAVRAFQRDALLNVDGVVGSQTRSALLDAVAPGVPDASAEPADQDDQLEHVDPAGQANAPKPQPLAPVPPEAPDTPPQPSPTPRVTHSAPRPGRIRELSQIGFRNRNLRRTIVVGRGRSSGLMAAVSSPSKTRFSTYAANRVLVAC